MVIPRFISSLCVSVHLPDSVWTRVVLPWSTWPIIPMFIPGWACEVSAIASSFFFLTITSARTQWVYKCYPSGGACLLAGLVSCALGYRALFLLLMSCGEFAFRQINPGPAFASR